MNTETFKFQDSRRIVEILKNNYALFLRRSRNENYGTIEDQRSALENAIKANNRHFELTGEYIDDKEIR